MARIREEDYAYATARIRAVENKLISRSKLERLFDAASPQDAIKLLMESGYGSDSIDNSRDGGQNIEMLLEAELKKAYDLLHEILPNPLAVRLFMRRNDYLNAKLILKAEFLGADAAKSLSRMGTVNAGKLSGMITERKLGELPEVFRKAVLESVEAFGQTGDPQAIDFILDRASYENMIEDAKETEEPFLMELVKRMADVANLRVFIRARLLNKSKEFIRRALVNGGSVPAKTYEELAEKPLEQFFEVLKFTELSDLSHELAKAAKSPEGLSAVEKTLEDSIILFLNRSRFVAMGIEPVIAYLFFKETEVKNARLIITGKANKLSGETLKERLRLGYA